MRTIKSLYFFLLCVSGLFTTQYTTEAIAEELSASHILSRMKSTYANAQTYQDQGMVEVVIRYPEREHIIKKPFSTAFVRPDRLRYEFTEIKPFGNSTRFVAYQNGDEVEVHWDLDATAGNIKSIDAALAMAAGISSGSARVVPSMLRPDQSRFKNPVLLYAPKRLDDERVDGFLCFRIEDTNAYHHLTLWIDQESFLLRKIVTRKELEGSTGETTTTYSPLLNQVIGDEKPGYGLKQ